MFLVFIPKNLGIAGGVGVLALNAIIGGIIGGFLVIITIIKSVSEENFDDIKWILNEPVKTMILSAVDDSIKANAEFQYKSGLSAKIVRTATRKCCEWCTNVSGDYAYPDVPRDVYRRHDNCRCTVNYHPGTGRKQNVWSKDWADEVSIDALRQRKQIEAEAKERFSRKAVENILGENVEKNSISSKINIDSIINSFIKEPKTLGETTHKEKYEEFKKNGAEIKTLNKGRLKGISYEEGGGYKVNGSQDGLYFQYHPKDKSHHKDEYYKMSSGTSGTKRYDMRGNIID